MAKKTHIRLATAVAALLSAAPALADQVTNFPGGSVHTWTGQHGESFTVIRNNRTGAKVTTIDRHDGLGPQPFVPEKAKITKPFAGSAYDRDTNRTTTRIVTPNGFAQMVDVGNTLRQREDQVMRRPPMLPPMPWMPGGMGGMGWMPGGMGMLGGMGMPGGMGGMPGGMPVKPWHASGSAYDPETNKTTTIAKGPNGSASMVEDGNTLDQHAHDRRRPPSKPISGSLYDPETNTTKTLVGGPGGWASTVEPGNTLFRH